MSMFALIYGVLFSLHFFSYECDGKITSPPDRTELTILPGSSMNITWQFNDTLSTVIARIWYFTSYSGLVQNELIAQITGFGTGVRKDILPGLDVIEPATLSLSNVSQSYDGTYQFNLRAKNQQPATSLVIIYIAKKPNVTFSCSHRNEVNEGDDFTCVCRGEGGRPPANVTWSKDGKQIGGIGKESQTLTLSNVNETHNGNYTCEARSYTNDEYVDKKYIEVTIIPNSKPNNTHITLTPRKVVVGEEVIIDCTSHGVPEPSYKITHTDTKTVRNVKTFTISEAKLSDAGGYECIAWNKVGNDSDSDNLSVVAEVQPTKDSPTTSIMTTPITTTPIMTTPITTTTTKGNQTDKRSSKDVSTKTEWYIVVVILVSGIIIGILFSYIVWCSHRRWFRNRKPERIHEPQPTEVDTTYQELDLTKMNKEDNNQSLKVNVASTDDDSTYTQLSKIRDVEDNYQSLT